MLRIAVADDEPDMLDYLRKVLPQLGHEVISVASTGGQLVANCRAHRPDLIIADVRMPELDGISATRTLCNDQPLPVILISGHHQINGLQHPGLEHVSVYLVKPVKRSDLEPAIWDAVERFAASKA
jgi:response regulator NasT